MRGKSEQKIRELKQRISKLKLIKSKSKNPHKLIKLSVNNMNKKNIVQNTVHHLKTLKNNLFQAKNLDSVLTLIE